MTDLKAHLKAFEKTFKEQHGREPSRQDIKARPEIADMYKAYSRIKVLPGSQSNGKVKEPPAKNVPSNEPARMNALFTTPKKSSRASEPSREMPHSAGPLPTYESANSPSKMRALISKTAFSPHSPATSQKSPFKKVQQLDAHQNSPRSKARKWLGGAAENTRPKNRSEPLWVQRTETSPVKAGHASFEPLFDERPAKTVFQRVAGPKISGPADSNGQEESRGIKRASNRMQHDHRPVKRRRANSPLAGPCRGKSLSPGLPRGSTEGHMQTRATDSESLPRVFDALSEDEQSCDELDEESIADAELPSRLGDSNPVWRAQSSWRQTSNASEIEQTLFTVDDGDRHADLIRMLDLNSSPARKQKLAFRNQKEALFAEVLGEPRARAEARLGRASGLEELAELNENGFGGSDIDAGEEGSDDDWASECEGWKTLDGTEMQSFSLFSTNDGPQQDCSSSHDFRSRPMETHDSASPQRHL